MFSDLQYFQRLVRQLQKVPFLASKNVYRVAVYFLTSDKKDIDQLCKTLQESKEKIGFCKVCFNLTEQGDLCTLCSSLKRDHSTICIVETLHDLFAIENSGGYTGVYHVLGGALCPLEGIGPDGLKVEPLLNRLKSSDVKEVIFATNPTPEGEATASYIFSKIKNMQISTSRLASGVPIGSNLGFMDRVTISKALSGRRPY